MQYQRKPNNMAPSKRNVATQRHTMARNQYWNCHWSRLPECPNQRQQQPKQKKPTHHGHLESENMPPANTHFGIHPSNLGPEMWEDNIRKDPHRWRDKNKMVKENQWAADTWQNHRDKNHLKQNIHKSHKENMEKSPTKAPRPTSQLAWQPWGFSG